MKEREEAERLRTILRQREVHGAERKRLEELAEWHHQNCIEALKQSEEWIPGCIKDFIFGYRKQRPDWREIQQEYARRQEFFKEKEKIRIKIALAFAAAAVLYILFKLR